MAGAVQNINFSIMKLVEILKGERPIFYLMYLRHLLNPPFRSRSLSIQQTRMS
jgi:hypothetical protein